VILSRPSVVCDSAPATQKQEIPRTRLRFSGQEEDEEVREGKGMQDLNGDMALAMTSDMLWTAIKLAAPLIGVTTLVGLLVSILQTVTQIQESSLTFVPKLIAAAAVLLVLGGWMMSVLSEYAIHLIANIPNYL